MTKIRSLIAGVLLGLLGSIALTAVAVDYGWSPPTGLEAFHGSFVSQGPAPALVLNTLASGNGPNVVVSGTAGCGTLATPKGGGTSGQVTLGTFAASCAITLTFPTAAPNGWNCKFNDLTTGVAVVYQATSTTTTCVSFASTTEVTADVIQFLAVGY